MPNSIDVGNLCMGCMSVLEKPDMAFCPHCGWNQNQPSAPHQLKPCTILNGKYMVGRVLGEGGFGITYLGWDINLAVKVAVKEYYPTGFVTREITSTGTATVMPYTGDKEEFYNNGLEKFLSEARSLAKFYTLPGIVAVKDFFRENGTAYIVMEYVEGVTMKQYLSQRGGRLPVAEVLGFMRPLLQSLEQVHNAGLIHRDISPDNIMIASDGNVKLLDFGAARDFLSNENKSLSVLLKPGYAPEEQYRTRGHQGPWTDVYALCATIYKMITGETPPESLDRMHADSLKCPSQMGIPITPAQENALLTGLAVLQQSRYQSIRELNQGLYETNTGGGYAPQAQAVQYTVPAAPAQPEYAQQTVPVVSTQQGYAQPLYTVPVNTQNNYPQSGYPMPAVQKKPVSKNTIIAIAASVAAVVLIIVGISIFSPKGSSAVSTKDEAVQSKSETAEFDNKAYLYFYDSDTSTSKLVCTPIGSKDGGKGVTPDPVASYAVADGWVYYINSSDHYLYRIDTNQSNRKKISDDDMSKVDSFKIYKGYLYYLKPVSDSVRELVRMKADGSDYTVTRMNKDIVIFGIQDGALYYSYVDESSKTSTIEKTSLDGTGKSTVYEGSGYVSAFTEKDGWLYFENLTNDSELKTALYKIKTDGTQKTLLNDEAVFQIQYETGGYIYVMEMNTDFKLIDGLYRLSMKDGKEEDVDLNCTTDYAISDGCPYIFYVSSDKYSIMRMNKDGSGLVTWRETDDKITSKPYIVGDYVYYDVGTDTCWGKQNTAGNDQTKDTGVSKPAATTTSSKAAASAATLTPDTLIGDREQKTVDMEEYVYAENYVNYMVEGIDKAPIDSGDIVIRVGIAMTLSDKYTSGKINVNALNFVMLARRSDGTITDPIYPEEASQLQGNSTLSFPLTLEKNQVVEGALYYEVPADADKVVFVETNTFNGKAAGPLYGTVKDLS